MRKFNSVAGPWGDSLMTVLRDFSPRGQISRAVAAASRLGVVLANCRGLSASVQQRLKNSVFYLMQMPAILIHIQGSLALLGFPLVRLHLFDHIVSVGSQGQRWVLLRGLGASQRRNISLLQPLISAKLALSA